MVAGRPTDLPFMSDFNPDGAATAEPIYSDFKDDADMMELVEFFVEELGDRISSLQTALDNNDTEQLRVLAHQLKGAAGGYGFPTISDTAAELEKAAVASDSDVSALTARCEALIGICRRASK